MRRENRPVKLPVAFAPRFPQPGETVLGGEFHTAPGGKGANQAVVATRAGGDVAMIGQVGVDAFGAQLLAGLTADGVIHRVSLMVLLAK